MAPVQTSFYCSRQDERSYEKDSAKCGGACLAGECKNGERKKLCICAKGAPESLFLESASILFTFVRKLALSLEELRSSVLTVRNTGWRR